MGADEYGGKKKKPASSGHEHADGHVWVHAEADGHVWTCWPADVEADDCKENKNKNKKTHPAGGEHKCAEGVCRRVDLQMWGRVEVDDLYRTDDCKENKKWEREKRKENLLNKFLHTDLMVDANVWM